MRMSCNGCRVLRKGCSDSCSIRPCLEWIKTPDSQANATVFLAKFYGRAGLMNLVNAAPPHLRPAIFRSLLYEACGRIVNPIHGSVGLMWSGSWQLCHNAVEAVLKGAPITQMPTDAAETKNGPPFKAYDIRHVNKEYNFSNDLHPLRNRCRFKRSKRVRAQVNRSPSHDSSLSHQSLDRESLPSAGNHGAEPALDSVREDDQQLQTDDGEIELDLTLGFQPPPPPLSRCVMKTIDSPAKQGAELTGFCKMELRLSSPAS